MDEQTQSDFNKIFKGEVNVGSKEKHIRYVIKKGKQKQSFDCRRKKRFNSPEMAIASAMRSNESSGLKYDLFYYECKICGGLHLTKSKGVNNTFAA